MTSFFTRYPYISNMTIFAALRHVRMKALRGIVLAVMLFGLPALAAAEQNNDSSTMFLAGYSSNLFTEVDQDDARIAMDLWAKEMAKNIGIHRKPQAVIFKDSEEMLNAVKRGELSIVTLSALEYLKIPDKSSLTPTFVSERNTGEGYKFVLIVNRESGIRSVTDLRNKNISLNSSKRNETSFLWLDILLLKEGYQDRASFFNKINESSSSQAIMKVFFRQTDAAVVSRVTLETSIILNPQIGKKVMVIAESKGLLGNISCIPINVDAQTKRLIEETAIHLHETPIGQQIITLFQSGNIIPFNPSYLEGIKELLQEKEELQAKVKKKI